LAEEINATPNTLKMNPIEVTVPNLSMFFKIRQNAFHAEAQKFFPVIAIYRIEKLMWLALMNL